MPKFGLLITYLALFVGLAGCSTLPSAENVFENNDTAIEANEVQATVSLVDAIDYTQSDLLDRYWFRAYVANNIEKRRITHRSANGIVVQPEGYYMNNTFITRPYEYFQTDGQSYVRNNKNWFRGREPIVSFDPFYGFEEWSPFFDRSEIIGEDLVLSVPTAVHQIELTGRELSELDSPLIEQLTGREIDRLTPILDQTRIRVLFYIGQPEKSTGDMNVLPIIYKYQTWIQMPIPGAGYMEQEIQHFLFRVNEEVVRLPDVDQIERYVIEIDRQEQEDQMKEELEQMEEDIEEIEEQLKKEND
ncbi:hypothetical protein ACERII_18670 [Evansella sp. AB-rgal1]|uniref:hypothetical protein n=1 Tax=Evansella sp. AB-rgal1 TaxID=3242696 RepID=UPI00359E33C6